MSHKKHVIEDPLEAAKRVLQTQPEQGTGATTDGTPPENMATDEALLEEAGDKARRAELENPGSGEAVYRQALADLGIADPRPPTPPEEPRVPFDASKLQKSPVFRVVRAAKVSWGGQMVYLSAGKLVSDAQESGMIARLRAANVQLEPVDG